MNKILSSEKTVALSQQLRNKNKAIVLAGGCFDILQIGHISFLQKAKEHGDILIVLLENDAFIKKTKGENRPINTQSDRAQVLSALTAVDYVLPLPGILKNKEYDKLILALKPAIIATTKADPTRIHKDRQAKLCGASVVEVNELIQNQSTTRIAKLLQKEL